jgi:chromate transporter
MERLEHAQRLQGALAAITAAVVGVIANLALWFAVHVVFAQIGPNGVPVWESLDWRSVLIGAGAALLLFRVKLGVLPVLATSAMAALGLSLL